MHDFGAKFAFPSPAFRHDIGGVPRSEPECPLMTQPGHGWCLLGYGWEAGLAGSCSCGSPFSGTSRPTYSTVQYTGTLASSAGPIARTSLALVSRYPTISLSRGFACVCTLTASLSSVASPPEATERPTSASGMEPLCCSSALSPSVCLVDEPL
jgi:hypothetical protein